MHITCLLFFLGTVVFFSVGLTFWEAARQRNKVYRESVKEHEQVMREHEEVIAQAQCSEAEFIQHKTKIFLEKAKAESAYAKKQKQDAVDAYIVARKDREEAEKLRDETIEALEEQIRIERITLSEMKRNTNEISRSNAILYARLHEQWNSVN